MRYKHDAEKRKELKKMVKRINQRITEIEKNNHNLKSGNFYKKVQAMSEREKPFIKITEKGARFRSDFQQLSSKTFNELYETVSYLLTFKSSTKSGMTTVNQKGYQTFIANHPDVNMSFGAYIDMWSIISQKNLMKYGSSQAIDIIKNKPEEVDMDTWIQINKEINNTYKSELARRKHVLKVAAEKGWHFLDNN